MLQVHNWTTDLVEAIFETPDGPVGGAARALHQKWRAKYKLSKEAFPLLRMDVRRWNSSGLFELAEY